MVKEQAGKWVVPNPQIPRSFGLMNIVFGILMLLLPRLATGLVMPVATDLQKQFQSPDQAQQEKQKADRADKIAELKAQETAAKTEEEKQDIGG